MELNDPVGFEFDSGLAIVTLRRGEKGNTLSPESIDLINSYIDSAYRDDSIRALLIRSSGGAFCSGMDLTSLVRSLPVDTELLRSAIASFAKLLGKIQYGPKPVIAAVTGDLLAGGVGLAGACDIVHALDSVQVQLGELVFGLIPANIMPTLVGRRMSEGDFRRLALTASRIGADEAARIGLFDSVSPDRKGVEVSVKATLKQFFRMHPGALRRMKSLLAAQKRNGGPSIVAAAESALTDLASDPATLDSIKAIDEGASPPWFARFRPEGSILTEEDSNGRA